MKMIFVSILVLIFVFNVIGCNGMDEDVESLEVNLEEVAVVNESSNGNVMTDSESEGTIYSRILIDPTTGDATTSEGFVVKSSYVSEKETSYFLVDDEEILYISINHPYTKKITKVAGEFCMKITTRSYETMTGREGFEYFTDSFKEEEEASARPLQLTSYYKGNELVLEGIGVEEILIKLDASGNRAEVTSTYTAQVVSSVDSYGGDNVEAGVLKGIVIFELVLDDNQWLIDGIVVVQ